MYITLARKTKAKWNFSLFSKLHKENYRNNKNVFTFLIFYLLSSSFFFSDFTFYKEALYFIMFTLSFCSNTLTLESIFQYIRQLKKKKHAHFKISSQDEVFTCLFVFFSSRDGISSLSFWHFFFSPGWNFISTKTCKRLEAFHHRQGWFHTGMKFHV